MHALLKTARDEVILEHRISCLLHYFCEHPQLALTKEELLQHVWAGRVVNEDSLSVAVSKLRKVLQDNRGEPTFIKTIPGVGYCWLPTTQQVDAVGPLSTKDAKLKGGRKRFHLNSRLVSSIILALALIVIGWLVTQNNSAGEESIPPASEADTRGLSASELEQFEIAERLTSAAVFHEATIDDYRQAISIYRELLKAHPNFIPAHIGIGEAKFEMSGINGYEDLQLYIEELNTIVALALSYDPQNGDALELKAKLAWLGEWDLDTAEQFYQRTIEAMPNDPGVYLGFSEFLISRGRMDEAKHLLSQLRKKNPSFYRYVNLSLVYMFEGEYAKAVAETKRLMNSEASSVQHHVILHRIGVLTDDDATALEHLAIIMREKGYSDVRIARYQSLGKKEGIAAVFAALLEESNEDYLGHYLPPLAWSRYAVIAGDTEQALLYLRDAVEKKQPATLLVHEDPLFDPLRQLPEFQEIVQLIPH